MIRMVEYVWMDGAQPTQKLRSKTKFLNIAADSKVSLEDFPDWGYDGSSTYQSEGQCSDLILKPVSFIKDALNDVNKDFVVMCEVLNPDETPHVTNTRAKLRAACEQMKPNEDPWIGFEQEYTLFKGHLPLGWPEGGFPAPQGPFYCGVGADEVHGRQLVMEHAKVCIDSNLMIFGLNAEVMPGQWEFQVGYRGISSESADPLTVSDHLWLARWYLYRLGEGCDIIATLDPKPVKGDWNGAGLHTNFSTSSTRNKECGIQAINAAVERLSMRHEQHIEVYGHGLKERLTGLHETCNISEFKHGVSDRQASIRIPAGVAKNGYGYLEDRRPGANADPYMIATKLIESICLEK